jgi:hypothetical protein
LNVLASLPGQFAVTRIPVIGHTSTLTPRSAPGGGRREVFELLDPLSEFSQVFASGVGLGVAPGAGSGIIGLPFSS